MPAATAAAIVFWAASVGSRMQPSPIRSSPAAGQSPVPVPPAMPHRASGDHHHTHQGYNRTHVGESPPRRRRACTSPCSVPRSRTQGPWRRERDRPRAAAPPPRPRRDDVRLVRRPHRAEAEPSRQRGRDRQLRDRGGVRGLRPRVGHGRRSGRGGGGDRVRGRASRRRPVSRGDRHGREKARRRRGADRAARASHDGRATSLRRLGMARPRRLDTGRPVVRRGVPPRCSPERAPPGGDDGHARLARYPRRLGMVDGRPARRARRAHRISRWRP